MATEQTIELDCAPGSPRPGDLIMGVVKGTILEPLTDAMNPMSMFMGNWVWNYQGVDETTWQEVQKVTQPRIVALYNAGAIRYGSW